MIEFIKLFLFIFSIILLLKYIILFGMEIISPEPEKIKITQIEGLCIMLSITYFFTYLFS